MSSRLILLEDDHLLAVDKPPGANTHAPHPLAGEGIYDWFKHRSPRWAALSILHRLDKETSGVLVFGKTRLANQSLTAQFTEKRVRKEYWLLTDRTPPAEAFTVRSALRRVGARYVSESGRGNEVAVTRFQRLGALGKLTLLKAEPLTGKSHQIRAQAAAQGVPILGDVVYGGTPAGRVFLHAARMEFQHPVTSRTVQLAAPCEFVESVEGHAGGGGDKILPRFPSEFWEAGTFRLVMDRRRGWIDPGETDALRLVHGAADGWPGWYVDRLGAYLLSLAEGPLADGQLVFLEEAIEANHLKGAYHKGNPSERGPRGSAAGPPRLVMGEATPSEFVCRENGLNFEIRIEEGSSGGLFLDQRDNRRRCLTGHVAAGFSFFEGPVPDGAEGLNTFAYTCSFSVAAARLGLRMTSVDLSRRALDWGMRNLALNGIDPASHLFLHGEVFDWLRRLKKKGRLFDLVLLDPPTFSRSKAHGVFQAEKDYPQLVEAALAVLKPGGILFASTNAARLKPERFLEGIHRAVGRLGRGVEREHFVPQPPDFPIARCEPGYLKTLWMRVG